MHLDSNQLDQLADLACEAALAAGNVICSHAPSSVAVKQKAGGDSLASQVVTEVDEKCQAVILNKLNASIVEYDLALLTEELPDDGSRLVKDFFWCIDPLDGTLPFTHGKPGYAVAIALVSRGGVPMIGVVYDPVEEVLWRSVAGHGLRLNGESWVRPEPLANAYDSIQFHVDCTFESDPHQAELTDQMQTLARRMGFHEAVIKIGGGAVLNACTVLEAPSSVYMKAPKPKLGGGSIWDFAATACIYEEAGAYVRDFSGGTLDLNSKAHTFFNHCGVCFCSDLELGTRLVENRKELFCTAL